MLKKNKEIKKKKYTIYILHCFFIDSSSHLNDMYVFSQCAELKFKNATIISTCETTSLSICGIFGGFSFLHLLISLCFIVFLSYLPFCVIMFSVSLNVSYFPLITFCFTP